MKWIRGQFLSYPNNRFYANSSPLMAYVEHPSRMMLIVLNVQPFSPTADSKALSNSGSLIDELMRLGEETIQAVQLRRLRERWQFVSSALYQKHHWLEPPPLNPLPFPP